jgi:hypothetical protein
MRLSMRKKKHTLKKTSFFKQTKQNMASEALTLEALHIATVYLKSENERLERENEELRADRGRVYTVVLDDTIEFFVVFEHYEHFIVRLATEKKLLELLAHVQSDKFSRDTPNFSYYCKGSGYKNISGFSAVPRTQPFEGTWVEYFEVFDSPKEKIIYRRRPLLL